MQWRPAYVLILFCFELSAGTALARRALLIPLPPRRPVDLAAPALTPPAPTASTPLPPPRPAGLTTPTVPPAEPTVSTPSPLPRPVDLAAPKPPPAKTAPVETPTVETPPVTPPVPISTPMPPTPDPACPRVLASKTLVVAAAPPVTDANGCGIAAPVTLSAVLLADGTKVPFEPPSLIRCDLAETLGAWFREDVAPAVQPAGGLAKILGSNGYECRTRNHVPGGKLSEHAKGNALDVRGIVLRNGQTILIRKDAPQKPAFLARMKATACARFTTVLGPGADAAHAAHLHVDLEQRHHGSRICEWDAN
ncbi:MAG: extensin family protein [Pseudomonadota bacterium]